MGFIEQIGLGAAVAGSRKSVASPFEGSHALCGRETDYRRALMLSACLTASLASGGARAQQALPDIQIGEAGPSAPAPYTGGRDAAEHPQYLPATVSTSAFGDQPPRDTPHSVNVIT